MSYSPGMNSMWVRTLAVLIAVTGWCAAESPIFDRNGQLTSMFYSGDELAVRGRVQIPSSDWHRMGEPTAPVRGGGRAGGPATITLETGKTAHVQQSVMDEGGRTWIAVQVTADTDLDIPGVYYTIDL